MRIKIEFHQKIVKSLTEALHQAYQRGDIRCINQVSALLQIHQGKSIKEIASTLSVAFQTVYRWLFAFLSFGLRSLVKKRSPGRKPKLTKTQKGHLKELVLAGPLSNGYPCGCWNSLLIQDLIYREFGVLYHRGYVCQLLKNLGFSWQKARFVSDHLDEVKRQQWKREQWPKILQEAQASGALLLFGDEASFPQWGTLSYTWAPKGHQPTVPTSGKRKGYKVFGLIDYFSGNLFYKGHSGRFNSDSYQPFLLEVMQQTSRPIILIQDNARYHTSKAMQSFFENHSSRITVYQLPSYSPDYNPIEYLWKKVKKESTHNRYFPDFDMLVATVEQALARLAQQPSQVLSLMGAYRDAFASLDFPKAA